MNNNISNNHNVLQIINDNNNNITPPIVDVKIINNKNNSNYISPRMEKSRKIKKGIALPHRPRTTNNQVRFSISSSSSIAPGYIIGTQTQQQQRRVPTSPLTKRSRNNSNRYGRRQQKTIMQLSSNSRFNNRPSTVHAGIRDSSTDRRSKRKINVSYINWNRPPSTRGSERSIINDSLPSRSTNRTRGNEDASNNTTMSRLSTYTPSRQYYLNATERKKNHGGAPPHYDNRNKNIIGDSGDLLDRFAGKELLKNWLQSFDQDAGSFSSIGLFAQVKLQEAIYATSQDPKLKGGAVGRSWIRTAVSLEILRRLGNSEQLSNYSKLFNSIHNQLAHAIYVDAPSPELYNELEVDPAGLEELCDSEPFYKVVRDQERIVFQHEKEIDRLNTIIKSLEHQLKSHSFKDKQAEKLLQVAAQKLDKQRLRSAYVFWHDWMKARKDIKSKLEGFVGRNNGAVLQFSYDAWVAYTEESKSDRQRLKQLQSLTKRVTANLPQNKFMNITKEASEKHAAHQNSSGRTPEELNALKAEIKELKKQMNIMKAESSRSKRKCEMSTKALNVVTTRLVNSLRLSFNDIIHLPDPRYLLPIMMSAGNSSSNNNKISMLLDDDDGDDNGSNHESYTKMLENHRFATASPSPTPSNDVNKKSVLISNKDKIANVQTLKIYFTNVDPTIVQKVETAYRRLNGVSPDRFLIAWGNFLLANARPYDEKEVYPRKLENFGSSVKDGETLCVVSYLFTSFPHHHTILFVVLLITPFETFLFIYLYLAFINIMPERMQKFSKKDKKYET